MHVGPVNVYLFTAPEPVLVDTGIKSAESWQALQTSLAEHGLTVLDLSRVFITHAHLDHDGQAGTIVAHSDADVWISEVGAPFRQHREVIQRQRARIIERKNECLAWIRAGYATAAELVDKMYAHRPVELRFAGLWMLIGYLDLLKMEGGDRGADDSWRMALFSASALNARDSRDI